MNPVSAGYKTTEFWVALIARIGGLILAYLALTNKISTSDATGFINVFTVVLGLLGPSVSDTAYIKSREVLKKSMLVQPQVTIS